MRNTSVYDAAAVMRFQVSMLSLAVALERCERPNSTPEAGAVDEVDQLRAWDERLND